MALSRPNFLGRTTVCSELEVGMVCAEEFNLNHF
jgi:hypothetical protein